MKRWLEAQMLATDLTRLVLLNTALNVALIVYAVTILIDRPSFVSQCIQWTAVVVNLAMLFLNGSSFGRERASKRWSDINERVLDHSRDVIVGMQQSLAELMKATGQDVREDTRH